MDTKQIWQNDYIMLVLGILAGLGIATMVFISQPMVMPEVNDT